MIVILYLCFVSDVRMLRRDDSECENLVVGVITQTFAISMCGSYVNLRTSREGSRTVHVQTFAFLTEEVSLRQTRL